jgi:hypothetical protein
MTTSLSAAFEATAGNVGAALDVGAALVGLASSTNFTESVSLQGFDLEESSASFVKTFTTGRLVAPTNGQTVRPVFSYSQAFPVILLRQSIQFFEV